MCVGVALLLGGDALVIAIAFLAAIVIDRLKRAMGRRRLPSFYQQIAGGGAPPCWRWGRRRGATRSTRRWR